MKTKTFNTEKNILCCQLVITNNSTHAALWRFSVKNVYRIKIFGLILSFFEERQYWDKKSSRKKFKDRYQDKDILSIFCVKFKLPSKQNEASSHEMKGNINVIEIPFTVVFLCAHWYTCFPLWVTCSNWVGKHRGSCSWFLLFCSLFRGESGSYTLREKNGRTQVRRALIVNMVSIKDMQNLYFRYSVLYPQTSSLTSVCMVSQLFYLTGLTLWQNRHCDCTILKVCIWMSETF